MVMAQKDPTLASVLVIGAGQLGSRHLQSLGLSERRLDIAVVDPSDQSLATAKSRLASVSEPASERCEFLREVPRGRDIDVGIVATNSDVRFDAIRELVTANRVRFLLLEKILFARPDQYDKAADLLREHQVEAWVNCPKRTFPIFRKLKALFGAAPIEFSVHGSRFGLACNAMHFIDCVSYLVTSLLVDVDVTGLDPRLVESKRSGFLEINGSLRLRYQDGTSGSMTCYADGDSPVEFSLWNQNARCHYVERDGVASIATAATAWQYEIHEARIPLQSETTAAHVNEILSAGDCGLTPLEISIRLHLAFLEPLRLFVERSRGASCKHYPFT